MQTPADTLTKQLRALGTPERAEQGKRYLKSEIEHLGVTVPDLRSVAKTFKREHPDTSHDELFSLVDALWSKPVFERKALAVELLQLFSKLPGAEDLPRIERLIRGSYTWALVDPLAVHVVGPLVTKHTSLGTTLDRWSKDEDFWIRRSAMLALLLALRKSKGDWPRFTRYADAMLHEKEFFIRKAIGWVLRESSRTETERLVTWLLPRAKRASGVTLREALKPLSETQRAAVQRALSE